MMCVCGVGGGFEKICSLKSRKYALKRQEKIPKFENMTGILWENNDHMVNNYVMEKQWCFGKIMMFWKNNAEMVK